MGAFWRCSHFYLFQKTTHSSFSLGRYYFSSAWNFFFKFFYCTIEKKAEILILKKKDLQNILIITIYLYRFLFHIVHLRALFHFLSQWRTLAISKIFKIGNGLLGWSLQSHSSRVGNWFPFCLRNKVSFWFFFYAMLAFWAYEPCSYLDHWNMYSLNPSKGQL